ncbi:MAG: sigma-70 family RNA polymerase sigma factor [Oscillospiraceae bacterium]|nr:sigma-70 family RNA polymerase sigma factor [Oscillospiraceae bacterium]
MDNDNIFEVNNSFYEKYNPTIRGIVTNILKYTNQSQDIDDCVNTVFLSLMEKLQQYNETRGSMAAFVIMITRSTALDYRRNSNRKISELVSDDKIDFLSEPIEFEDEVEFDVLVEKIILEKLNNEERRLYTMKYILFDPPEEIAKCFNINRNAADARIHRLKSKIKSLMKKGGITI